jgi:flagellar biosynthesis protein FlhA
MDGVSMFFSGSLKVGIFITTVNVLGGIVVGIKFHGQAAWEAVRTYIFLSVGDGLLFLIPAMFFSLSTGILINRSIDAKEYEAVNH